MKIKIDVPEKKVNIKGVHTQAGFIPEGTIDIIENGEADVFNYAKANVNVPEPSGELEITENGKYNVKNYADVIANVSIPNLLYGVTFENGILNSDGAISSPSPNKEVVSDYIPFSNALNYILLVKYTTEKYISSSARNLVCGLYDENKNFITRLFITENNVSKMCYSFAISGSAYYIRVGFRTYGDCKVGLYNYDEFTNMIQLTP